MRSLLSVLCLCLAGAALAAPVPKKSEAPSPTADRLRRRAVSRTIAEQAGLLGALSSGGQAVRPSGPGFRAADAAYARGEWAKAYAAYRAAGAEGSDAKARRASPRFGVTCQAVGKLDCALTAASHSQGMADILGSSVGAGLGGEPPDTRSRLERALPKLIRLRRQAERARDPEQVATLYQSLVDRDPRCPDRGCPPFILREAGEALHRAGRHARGAALLATYLKVLPKAQDRVAAKRLLEAAQAAEAAAKAKQQAALDARQLRLPTAEGRAPWQQQGEAPRARFEFIRFGGPVGVAQMRAGADWQWLGVTHGERAVGPLAIPEAPAWVAVGGDGAIYSVTEDGALYRAADLAQARRGFTRLAAPQDVEHWHLAGDTVVASGERVVHVSTDGGAHFTTHTHDRRIGKAWARADGVVAFGDARGAWVSADGGQTWSMTPLGDMTDLRSDGQRIYQPPREGRPGGMLSQPPRCAQGELTADRRWVVAGEPQGSRRASGWGMVFRVGDVARAPKAPATGAGRAAATQGEDALPTVRACEAAPATWFKARRGGGGAISGLGDRCRGLDCLVRPGLPPAPLHFGLLGDAPCGEADPPGRAPLARLLPTDRRQPAPRWGGADRGALSCAVTGPGTLVRIGPDGARRLPPVADCDLRVIQSAGGLGVGLCQGPGAPSLVILDADGVARERQPLPGPVEDIALAPDGTLLVQARAGEDHTALVRRPVALGDAGAWRAATVPGAVAWRVVAGGRALAIQPGADRSRGVRASHSARDGRYLVPWQGRHLAGVEACYAEAFAADPTVAGRLTVTATLEGDGAAQRVREVRFKDDLTGDAAGLRACLEAHVRQVPPPRGAKASVAHTFEFRSEPSSYRLVLSEPGGTRAVTEDVTFSAPPKQIAVLADGTVQVTERAYPVRVCTVPRAGAPLCPTPR